MKSLETFETIKLDDYDLNESQKDDVKKYIKSLKSNAKKDYENCPLFDKCNAQVCPMDSEKERKIWYADEGICINPEYKDNMAVINQKKIARKHASGYFNWKMLNRKFIIGRGIHGIDPDVPEAVDLKGQKAVDALYEQREKAWFRAHPELTEEQKEKKRLQGMAGTRVLKSLREVKK